MKPYYLYKIENKVNGKLYIGITKEPNKRKARHFSKTGHTSFSLVRKAVDKYGKDNFSFEIICIGNKEYILDLEVKVIAAYLTQDRKFGYNIKPGGESGRGYSVGGTKRDRPVYVSGWWFPNRRTALSMLNMSISVYKNRQRRKTVGNIVQDYEIKPNGGVIKFNKPYKYFAGFWFPSLMFAASILNKNYSMVVIRYAKGDCEEFVPERRGGNQSGSKNNRYSVSPENNPNSVAVIINSVTYNSLKEAVAHTGYSKYIIKKRIKDKNPDFNYV